jgi:RNA 2',3'-cyclic 3'-phosphodiesterase
MRLFIAIEPDESVLAHLRNLQETMRPLLPARWIPPDQLHLTLKFLGDTPDPQLPDLITALKNVTLDSPLLLQISGVICFPPRGPIRIIATSMEDDQNRCAQLAQRIDRACHEVGFQLENRRWTPHVTLARIKERTSPDIRRRIASIQQARLSFDVEEFVLKESRLDDKGPTYITVATFA